MVLIHYVRLAIRFINYNRQVKVKQVVAGLSLNFFSFFFFLNIEAAAKNKYDGSWRERACCRIGYWACNRQNTSPGAQMYRYSRANLLGELHKLKSHSSA